MKTVSVKKPNKSPYSFPTIYKKQPGIINIRIDTVTFPQDQTQKCDPQISESQHTQQNQTQQHPLKQQQPGDQHLVQDLFADVRPLPSPWQMLMASDKSFYFRNSESEQEQRERPFF